MTPGERHGKHPPREIFSPKKAAYLDTRLRRFIYRPDRLAEKLITPGSRVLDFGCGPGFFTRAFAKRVGGGGQVFAVDLQEEMLVLVWEKLEKEGLLSRVTTHQCLPDSINLPSAMNGTFDVATAIFVVHEVPDPEKLFREIYGLLKPGGTFFYTEPPLEVPGTEFNDNLAMAGETGFAIDETSWYFVNRAAVLKKK